jgi:hypothetical protein
MVYKDCLAFNNINANNTVVPFQSWILGCPIIYFFSNFTLAIKGMIYEILAINIGSLFVRFL